MFGLPILVGLTALLFALSFLLRIKREPPVPAGMKEIGDAIAVGAKAYLFRQLKTISLVVPFLFLVLLIAFGWQVALTAVLGVYISLIASFIGMGTTTFANTRVANACRTSNDNALRLAVFGGAIMGLCVTGLSLISISILYFIFNAIEPLVGFGFGASLAALFAQIGGGIFTKSADIGADLVGKVEKGLPEDDPRNAAVIADLVGDNVGDCAGRGSDLFQTFSDDIVTGTLVAIGLIPKYGPKAIFLPILLQCCGVLSSIVGILVTRIWSKKMKTVTPFNIGLWLSAALSVLSSFILTRFLLPDLSIWLGVFLGIVTTMIAAISTKYYAGMEAKPVREIASASKRGAALNLITGISYGLISPIPSIVMIVAAIIIAYVVSGGSLLAVVAVNIGTDLLIAFIMAADCFGPITDNAAGIAEMSKSEKHIVKNLASLDSVGNTMKAITKAYAMSSGTITAFVIFATFFTMTGIHSLSVIDPRIIGFILMGIALPFIIASITIGATAKGALLVVDEVRRQFREIKGLLEGKAKPNYANCVDIATKNALKQMVLPGLVSVLVPMVIGFAFGAHALGALLIGAVLSSALLGPFFNNTGTSFDNAKKYIEEDDDKKGTPEHAAAVVGDTVGDPLKDVAGPSLLIFMKLIGMSALLIAPLIR